MPHSETPAPLSDHPADATVPDTPRGRSTRLVAAITSLAVTLILFLLGAGSAHADPDPSDPVPPDAVSLSDFYGTGRAWVTGYGLATRIHTVVTDTRADSRCAYVAYRVDAPLTITRWHKAVRVCGAGRSDAGTADWVAPTWTSARTVEVKVCREQGLGDDPCSPVTEIAV